MAGSFIENVNTVANATVLATGDIIEDCQIARDEAQNSAENAALSESNAEYHSDRSQEWANKQFNQEVEDGRFSSYHWSIVSADNSAQNLIDDNVVSTLSTWSSDNINNNLKNKSDTDHDHLGVYEPVFSKNSAFNKNFDGTGSAEKVSRSDHDHPYEPEIGIKGTAFNKNFGIAPGTVAEGNHRHDNVYMPYAVQQTAYNKPFVLNSEVPGANEVPRGNHIHKAAGISYDSTGNTIISSSTAQGATGQLDAYMAQFSVAPKAKINATLTATSFVVPVSAQGAWNIVAPGMTSGPQRAQVIWNSGVQISYDVVQEKLIEGRINVTITTELLANQVIDFALGLNGTVADTTSVKVGSTDKSTAGAFPITLSVWVSALEQLDTITIHAMNETDTEDITIYDMLVSFDGAPEGAIVASGTSVAHNDTTGRDADATHPTGSIYKTGNSGLTLDTILDDKQDLVVPTLPQSIALLDENGVLVSSEIEISNIDNGMSLISSPESGNIVTMDSGGDSVNSGVKTSELALVGGSSTQVFEVSPGTELNEAVTFSQYDAVKATADGAIPNIGDGNANNFAKTTATGDMERSPFNENSFAPASHEHVQSDISGLADTLAGKYDVVVGQPTNNIPIFGDGNTLVDSTYELSDLLPIDYTGTIGNINSPLLDMPLNNSLSMKQGVGSAMFSRASEATYTDMYGVFKTVAIDEPRFTEHGYLIEGESTNLLIYSEDILNDEWRMQNGSVAQSTELGPDGVTPCVVFSDNTVSSTHGVNGLTPTTVTVGNNVTGTWYVKLASTGQVNSVGVLFMGGNSNGWQQSTFNIETEQWLTAIPTGAKNRTATKLANGWWKFSMTLIVDEDTITRWRILSAIDHVTNYTGVGEEVLYIAHPQLEELDFATSHIPTADVVATRKGDILDATYYGNMANWKNPSTIMVDLKPLGDSHTKNRLILTTYNTLYPGYINLSMGNIVSYKVAQGEFVQGNSILTDGHRLVCVNDGNEIRLFLDGVIDSIPGASGTADEVNTTISIGHFIGENQFFGYMKNLRIYNKTLSDSEIKMA